MKLLPALLLSGVLLTACVDQDYDLTKVDFGNASIGDENSEFKIPLASIHVSMEEISQDGTDIQALFEEADIWLPSSADQVDISELSRNAEYRHDLILETIDEMKTDDRKLNAIVDLTYRSYYAQFAEMLGLDPWGTPDPSAYAAAFAQAIESEFLAGQIETLIEQVSSDFLASIRIDSIEYALDPIDLDDTVIDMLCENLDPEGTPDAKNTLALYGTISSRLPLSMHLEPLFMPADIALSIDVEAGDEPSRIPETRLYGDDLRSILDGSNVRIPIELGTYYRNFGFDNDSQNQLVIQLHLVKRGGLKLEF